MKKMSTVLCALALLLAVKPAGAKDDLEWARQVTSRIEIKRTSSFAKSSSDPRSRNWRESLNWNADWQEALRASEIMISHYPNDPDTVRLHHHILGHLHRWKEACDFGMKAREIVEKSGDLECLFWVLYNQFWFINEGKLSVQDDNWKRGFKKYRTTAVVEQMLALAESMDNDDLLFLSYDCYAWHHGEIEYWKKQLAVAQRNHWQDRIQWANMRIIEHYTHSNQIEKSIEWSKQAGMGTDVLIYVVQKNWPKVYDVFSPRIGYIEQATLRQPNERLQREVITWNTRCDYDNTAVACAHLDRLNEAIETSERLHNRMLGMILGARFEQGLSSAVVRKRSEQHKLQSKLDQLNGQLTLAKKDNDADKIGAIQRDLKLQASALTGLAQDIAADELEINAARVPPKMSVSDMQSLLGSEDALIIYYPTATWFMTEGVISVLTRQRATCALQDGLYVRDGDPACVKAKADDLLKALTSTESSAERGDLLRKSNDQLYSLLIKPILPQIRDKRNLIIVPSGPLSTLPVHLLRNEQGKFLMEDHIISYVPSVGVLKYALARNKNCAGQITVIANPLIPQANSSLKFAETEAQAIAEVFPRANLLVGDRATETAVKAILDKTGIIHFACHGILDTEEPMKSALALAPDETNDGMLTAREICDYPIKAGLVVLSACESGAGAPSAGWAELLGMTRSWLLAGAPSVVVSLWKLDDKATSELMAEFYKNLKIMPRAEALQKAQLTMMKKYENPYYWGAFVLYGDYR